MRSKYYQLVSLTEDPQRYVRSLINERDGALRFIWTKKQRHGQLWTKQRLIHLKDRLRGKCRPKIFE